VGLCPVVRPTSLLRLSRSTAPPGLGVWHSPVKEPSPETRSVLRLSAEAALGSGSRDSLRERVLHNVHGAFWQGSRPS